MGDGKATEKVTKPDAQEQHRDGENRLRAESLEAALKRSGGDKVKVSGSDGAVRELDNPFNHIGQAGLALKELERIKGENAAGKAVDASGKPLDMTVAQYRENLVKTADREFKQAITAADLVAKSDKYASEHNLPSVDSVLLQVREQQGKAKSTAETLKLNAQENSLEARKHSPSVVRCVYAEFLANSGNLVEAQKYFQESGKIDSEARNSKQFQKLFSDTETQLRTLQQQKVSDQQNPYVALDAAVTKQKAGDMAGAEAEYKRALELAGPVTPQAIQERLQKIEQATRASQNDPAALERLKLEGQAITSFAHVKAQADMSYADFLLSQNRPQEAAQQLAKAATDDPQFVKNNKDYTDLQLAVGQGSQEKAAASGAGGDNPFLHFDNFMDAVKKQDMKTAQSEIDLAVKAAEKLDHKAIHEARLAAEATLKAETDPDKRQELQTQVARLSMYDHAVAMTKLAQGELALANKQYNTAHTIFEDIQKKDPEFANRPQVKMNELLEKAQEPSFWDKTVAFTKSLLKDLTCDAAAILAGAVAGALTIETGPGALVAAGAAGSLAYMGMKKLVWGDELSWADPLWGIADGLSGGGAAILRAGAVNVGEKVVAKELATKMVTRGGASALELETVKGGLTAARVGEHILGERVAQLGKGMTFWERQAGKVGLGEAGAYTSAYWAQKGLQGFNLATSLGLNATTAFGGSVIYRGAHDGVKYANGDYKSLSEFASNYANNVKTDTIFGTVAGTVVGPLSESGAGLVNRIAPSTTGSEVLTRLTQVVGTTAAAGGGQSLEAMAASDSLKEYAKRRKETELAPDDDEIQLKLSTLPQVGDETSEWQDQAEQPAPSEQPLPSDKPNQ